MIKIYTSPNCLSSIHAKQWFKDHNIDFNEKNFINQSITESELIDILTLSDNGLDDVLSQRSNEFKKNGKKLDNLTLKEMIKYIQKNPTILKRPIMIQYVNNKPLRLVIGFNSGDIEIFLRKDKAPIFHTAQKCLFIDKCNDTECATCQLKIKEKAEINK